MESPSYGSLPGLRELRHAVSDEARRREQERGLQNWLAVGTIWCGLLGCLSCIKAAGRASGLWFE